MSYRLFEATANKDGPLHAVPLDGLGLIPEEEVDFVVNLLRAEAEGREVIAVREIPREAPFEMVEPSEVTPRRIAGGLAVLLAGLLAFGAATHPEVSTALKKITLEAKNMVEGLDLGGGEG